MEGAWSGMQWDGMGSTDRTGKINIIDGWMGCGMTWLVSAWVRFLGQIWQIKNDMVHGLSFCF
jgi:hypothetical protein